MTDADLIIKGNSGVLYLSHGNSVNDFMEAMEVAAESDNELAASFAQDVIEQTK